MRSWLTGLLLLVSLSLVAAAQTGATKLEGQVVCCADCWAEADRTKIEFGTAEDLLKSKSCVEGGDPTLIAVREGDKFTLYQLEQGKFRLPGKNWLEYIGKRIAVTGSVHKKKESSANQRRSPVTTSRAQVVALPARTVAKKAHPAARATNPPTRTTLLSHPSLATTVIVAVRRALHAAKRMLPAVRNKKRTASRPQSRLVR
jgi:hypothetical protein